MSCATKIPLERAKGILLPIAEAMRPYCNQLKIAGSIRRRRHLIGDLELVVEPRWAYRTVGLFDDQEPVNTLYEWGSTPACPITWTKGFNPDGRFWQGTVKGTELKLDLFLATRENWGLILLLRTGSADFSRAIVTHAKMVGYPSEGGRLRDTDGVPICTPDEASIFSLLKLRYVPPDGRSGPDALYPL